MVLPERERLGLPKRLQKIWVAQITKLFSDSLPPPHAENQGVVRECFDLGEFLSLDISEDNEKQVGMLASLSFLFSEPT